MERASEVRWNMEKQQQTIQKAEHAEVFLANQGILSCYGGFGNRFGSVGPDGQITARLDNNGRIEFNASEHRRAYWLLDIIAIAQQHDASVSGEEFQVWNLKVHSDRSASVFCDDGNGNPFYTQEIPFTDFPLDEVKLYFANNVIHLPSEY